MADVHSIEGKTFLITGGASGLGAGYAEAFLKGGAKSIAVLDINEELGKATIARLNNTYPGKAIFVKCDVGCEKSIHDAYNKVVSIVETVDVIINNAGIMNDSDNVRWKASLVNYIGLVCLTFIGLKHMRKENGGKGGTIINISSVMGILRYPYLPVYAGSKAAVLHFSQCIAMDSFYEKTGVRVLTMCFGATNTPLLHNLDSLSYDKESGKAMAISTPENAYQRPESAINGLVDLFKKGADGSIWTALGDKPAKDITPAVKAAYEIMEKAAFQ